MNERLFWEFLDEQDESNPDPDAGTDTPSPARNRSTLSRRLEIMTMPQLTRILARYAPTRKTHIRATAIRYIEAALDTPAALQELMTSLEPFERLLLEELKRRGGQASGWQIHTAVTLRNLESEPAARLATARPGVRYSPGPQAVAAHELLELSLDGLLVFHRMLDSWSTYGHGDAAAELVSADPRLLEQVPFELPPPAGKLRLTTYEGTELTNFRHPAAVVLELLDVLQRTAQEGGLHVTRAGLIAKPFLNRLRKNGPDLGGDRLESLLRYLPALGFVRPPSDETSKQPWALDHDAIRNFRAMPLHFMYAQMVDASSTVNDPYFTRAWESNYYQTSRPEPFWTAVLQCLPALPDAPVEVGEAATAIWQQVLGKVFGPLGTGLVTGKGPVAAITRLLSDILPSLGLLTTGTGLSDSGQEIQLIAPATGQAWHTASRAMVEGASGRQPHEWVEAEQQLQKSGPALLVQPNFEVLVYLDLLTSASVRALTGASLQRLDAQTATFSMDRSSVNYALDAGSDVTALLSELESHARSLPANVAGAIHDWAARRERLRVHTGTRIIEYPDESLRDAALQNLTGGRALGERFVLLARDAPEPAVQSEFDYHFETEPSLKVRPDGTILARGALSLPARTVLQQLTTQESRHTFRISESLLRTHKSAAALHKLLASQADGGIPRELDVLLHAWRGQGPRPIVAETTVFHHPEASSWAGNPRISKLLGAQLSPSSYLVIPGQEAQLRSLLKELHVKFESGWPDAAALQSIAPAEGDLQTGLSTRKTRELIESAIQAGHQLELRYARETKRYTSRGFPGKNRGKVITEHVRPDSIVYEGSTPYLLARTVKRDTDVEIRVGYIEAIGVRPG